MELAYLNYCLPASPFYDVDAAGTDDFPEEVGPLPAGWSLHRDRDWTYCTPPEVSIPDQGWKIHVSATPENARHVLGLVHRYCTARGIMFKFLRAPSVLLRRNSKYGDRGGSGKFITIYPAGETDLERILRELDRELDGAPGPYILSDLRWRQGPLYVRYGGFVTRYGPDESGALVPCITDDAGRLVPDVRGPVFRPPSWISLPGCLADAVAARAAGVLADFPFRPTAALHFSNGGGVYTAVDRRTGGTVLLKEARPLAGLDEQGRDAVARLRQEHWALRRLAGLPCIPELIDYRVGHEHHFLAREFVDGESLYRLVFRRNPVLSPGRGRRSARERYTRLALRLLREVEDGLDRMHERGVVFGDLHPNNVLVRADGSVAFIDLETSSATTARATQAIGAPGFRAPEGLRGVEVDHYALGCLRLAVFLPLTTLLSWGPDKVEELLEEIGRQFPVGPEFADQVRHDLTGRRAPTTHPCAVVAGDTAWSATDPRTWAMRRQELVDSMLALATPERADRLFPGDVQQFLAPAGGLNLASGAAGVIWAMSELGADVPDELVRWLHRGVQRAGVLPPGGYDGMAGIALALLRTGDHDRARAMLEQSLHGDPAEADLYSGLAGIGLALLEFDRRNPDDALVDRASRLASDLDRCRPTPVQHAGLLRGRTGPGLFRLRLHERTGRPDLLTRAVADVRADLAAMGWSNQAAPDAGSPWHSPTLVGGAGVAIVAAEILRRVDDPILRGAVRNARRACRGPFLPHAGLLRGRAGAMIALRRLDGGPAAEEALRHHVRRLGWHGASVAGSFAFCGDHNLRLSTDLGSGTAGALLAVESVLGERPVELPLLGVGAR